MKRVDVVDAGEVSDSTNRHLVVFYTGLARALSFPRRMDEYTSDGKQVGDARIYYAAMTVTGLKCVVAGAL